MKRQILLCIGMGCLTIALHAQVISAHVQANQVDALIKSDGTLFNDGIKGHFIPVQAGLVQKTLLRGSGLWVAGTDAAGNLKGSIAVNDQTDYTPGFLQESGEPYTDILNNIWQVSCSDISQHLADFNDNGVIDNPNAAVYSYPAKGNPFFEAYNHQTLPLTPQPMAGYYDRNEDGNYNPIYGDYPSIEMRGCQLNQYAKVQDWTVCNDVTTHPSGLISNQLEVQTQVFAYDQVNPSPLNNAVYVRFRIINRSAEPLYSCYFGLFADFDIGNPGDDFMGSIPDKGILYDYNGDANDEGGFGSEIPVMAMDVMRGPLDTLGQPVPLRHLMIFENAANLQPAGYHNLLSGHFADGSPAPNGGKMYPGNPNTPNGNSEQAAGNTPGQRVGLASFGPFTLLPGADNELIAAYYFVHKPGATPLQNVQQLYSDAGAIQELFDNCFENMDRNCDGLLPVHESSEAIGLTIFPNPAATFFNIESEGAAFSHLKLTDLLGRQVLRINLENPVHHYELSTGNLPNGVYLLRVESAIRKVVVRGFGG